MSRIEHLVACQSQCGESPIWDPVAGRLCWTDTENPVFSSCDATGAGRTDVKADWRIQAIGRRKAGGWVTVVRDGLAIFDPSTGKSRFLGNPIEGKAHLTMNDGAVRPDGSFYAGSLNVQVLESDEGALSRLDSDDEYTCIQDGFVLPNGVAFALIGAPCTSRNIGEEGHGLRLRREEGRGYPQAAASPSPTRRATPTG